MKIKRLCKICGKEFFAIKSTQFFCCRKCFKKDYYIRMKMNIQKANQNPSYPKKECSFCGETSELNFDPIKNPRLFNDWRCPSCGVTNKMLWQNQNKQNSHELITAMAKENNKHLPVQEQKYQVYHIPINLPEQCNTKILTLACEVMDMLSIRKMDRKKIPFS